MVRRGRYPEKEKTVSAIIQTLEKHPEGLGVRELRLASGIKSNETFYKYLPELLKTKAVEFHESSVGRGKPKKIFRLTSVGQAYSVEFKVMDYFEKVRETCKTNEQFEIDNYAFSYAIYGLPKHLTVEEKEQVAIILKKINSALIDLDVLRYYAINSEAHSYRKAIATAYAMISQYVAKLNIGKKQIVIDPELRKELDSYIPSLTKKKTRLREDDKFALVITRGPSFIDEYSLRPENHLLELIESVERWDDDGLAYVIEQLAKNKYFDQVAIDRIKKWNNPKNRVSNFYWQKIKEKLDDIPKIREKQKKAKEQFIQSGTFRKVLGLTNGASLIVTKEMLGKERMDELKKELASLNSVSSDGGHVRSTK